jgi:hypothetical protein
LSRTLPSRRQSLLRAAAALAVTVPAFAFAHNASAIGVVDVAREAAPVVITGSQVPQWSRLAATGLANPYPSGATTTGDGVRTAHNGRIVVPADARSGVNPNEIAAFKWNGQHWVEVPVQVDQRFPYFLANGRSDFSVYSGTDEELTYAWNPDKHAAGEEAWKKIFGQCDARYATSGDEVKAAVAKGITGLGPQERPRDYFRAMQDPVPTLDDDDEISVMARDSGPIAPVGTPVPADTRKGQRVALVDPVEGRTRYVYLFLRPGGSSFTWKTSPYVSMQRTANSDEWIDRGTFAPDDPQKIGTSNTGYGPNLPGTVCRTSPNNDRGITTPDGTPRASTDRVPRDSMTVSTPTYRVHASGRWMVDGLRVTKPGTKNNYGPDLIARWKGRAFQQSPDSSVSVVGFEDEQVNWEANSALLGWRAGPVRAIREIWGADSGTNVTKTETYYRDADVYGFHVRVHPIPPDGLYTSWAYNQGAVDHYYNLVRKDGVAIDGVNDDVGQISNLPGGELPCAYDDQLPKDVPCPGGPAYFDTCDPTFDVCSAVDRPEEVAGHNGALVYEFEFTGATSATNPAAVPYYRDDACLDDGTGDSPVLRPWPGEATTDSRVKQGYVDYWKQHGAPASLTYEDLKCDPTAPAGTPGWKKMPFSGAIGQHGIHFFVTHDSDNAFGPKSVDEVDGQQWRFSVPMSTPHNVLNKYGLNVSAKLVPVVSPY